MSSRRAGYNLRRVCTSYRILNGFSSGTCRTLPKPAFAHSSRTFGFAVTLFGVIFIGAYLLVDVRRVEAAFLRAVPHDYRPFLLSLFTELPRTFILGNVASSVKGFSETHPLLKGGEASFPERDDDTVPSVKAQGSMPRLPFSPTAVPRTDIM